MRILFVIFILITPIFTQSRGLNIKVRDREGKEIVNYQKSYAIVFAASDYTNGWKRLPGVKQDAEEVKKVLEKHGFRVYVFPNPSARTIRRKLRSFINKLGLRRNNRLLFYYCGHGFTDEGIGGKMGYIVPVEAEHPSKNKEQFLSTAISMEEIKTYAKLMRCNHAMFLFDCCFAGTIFSSSRSGGEASAAINYKMSRPVRQFITSGSENEEVPDKSLFREIFVEALSGDGDVDSDGYITGTELGQYIESKVINYSENQQHPQFGKLLHHKLDKGDFVFVLKNKALDPEELKRKQSQLSKYQRMLQEEQQQKQRERERIAIANRKMQSINAEIAAAREKLRIKDSGSKLDDLLVLLQQKKKWAATIRRLEAEQKERERKERERLAQLKVQRIQQAKDHITSELQKYRIIANSEFAAEMKGDAWNALVAACPQWWQADNIPQYDEELILLSPQERQQRYAEKQRLEQIRLQRLEQQRRRRLEQQRRERLEQQKVANLGFTYLREKTYSCNGSTYTVKEYRHNRTGMEFVKIPGGSFTMGGGTSDDEKPAHRVTLDSFLLCKTEVTQGVWQKIMGSTPWQGKNYVKEGSNHAATYVSWNDAKEFCDRVGLQLPTEAQWEYACRSGSSDKYYWGKNMDGDYAWYDKNAYDIGNKYAHQVAQKKLNAFGLYDMSGNVYEWCHDWYDKNYYSSSPTANPKGPNSGSDRVYRGGSWRYNSDYCRSRYRSHRGPDPRFSNVGFRPSVHYP